MSTDTALIEKREELKRRLAAGEYRTLIDEFLDRISNILQKITRSPHPISQWSSGTLLYLILLLVLLLPVSIETIGHGVKIDQFINYAAPTLLTFILVVYFFSVVVVVAGNIYIHRVFTTFQENVLDTIESTVTMDDFASWIMAVCNRKAHLRIIILSDIPIVILFGVSLINNFESSEFWSPLFFVALFLLTVTGISTFLYLLLYMVLLSARIGKYDLRLYTADPASSEIISRLAGLLRSFIYLVAIAGAYLTLMVAISEFSTIQFIAGMILLFWVPIIAMFVINQNSISSIIRRAKWKTLNEISARIEQLHSSEKLGEQETMETINRLMDYYDRIKNTRNSTFDLGAGLNLINSLLLPLLALLLANIDKILALLK